MTDIDTAEFRDRWDEAIMIPSVEMYALCDALDTARADATMHEDQAAHWFRYWQGAQIQAEAAEAEVSRLRATIATEMHTCEEFEALETDYSIAMARITELEEKYERANTLGNAMTIGLGRAADERDEALGRIEAALAAYHAGDWPTSADTIAGRMRRALTGDTDD